MTASEKALAARRTQLPHGHVGTDSAVLESNDQDDRREDNWVTDFISRLAGTLRDMAPPRRKER